MASADAFTLSARVPHKVADEFKTLAESLGMSPNAMIKDMVERAVSGKPAVDGKQAASTDAAKAEIEASQVHVPRTYKVALDLVDDLKTAGYPETQIIDELNGIRRELL